MKRGKKSHAKKSSARHALSLPDLDQARSAVLNSLPSKESQRGYRHAIDEFITWYCSEPRLSFNKAVVTRYRIHLESRQLAPNTINGRLTAVRRLAYEAADSGLRSPDLAAGIRRVKGAKCPGVRLGNWLTAARDAMAPPYPALVCGHSTRTKCASIWQNDTCLNDVTCAQSAAVSGPSLRPRPGPNLTRKSPPAPEVRGLSAGSPAHRESPWQSFVGSDSVGLECSGRQ